MPQPRQPQQAQETPKEEAAEGFQEGSRWVNRRPDGEEFAEWFVKNVDLHPDMHPQKYAAGVVLIGAKEKTTRAVKGQNGTTQFLESDRYTWTPYAKVETRIAYFWDLMARHPEWLGVIEPVEQTRLSMSGYFNLHMPVGFFRLPLEQADGKIAHYLAATMQVRILERDTCRIEKVATPIYGPDGAVLQTVERDRWMGRPVYVYPPGTKMVPVLGRYGEDPNAIMKAETGAVGRALGMAGMLVIPGSGVSTADDMQELLTTGSVGVSPSLPSDGPPAAGEESQLTEEEERERLVVSIAELQTENPKGYEEFAAWAQERKINLNEIKPSQFRGIRMQVERKREQGAGETVSEPEE